MTPRRTAGQLGTGWVADLPSSWTSQTERLVLYVLALDAPNGVTRSGQLILAQRTGLTVPQLRTTLHALCVPTPVRPPLLERAPKRHPRDPDRYRLAPGTDQAGGDRLLPLATAGDGR